MRYKITGVQALWVYGAHAGLQVIPQVCDSKRIVANAWII